MPRMSSGYLAATLVFTACFTPGCGSSSGGVGTSGASGASGASGSGAGASGKTGTAGSTTTSGGDAGAAGEPVMDMAGAAGIANGGSDTGGAGNTAGDTGTGGTAGSSGGMSAGGGDTSGGTSGTAGSGGAGGGGASGSGGAPSCGADGVACQTNGGNGLCASQVCVACSADPECVTAYGANSLCLSGSCTPGDCRANSDCAASANGSICGATQPNFCGKCTSDTQCTGGQICNTGTGQCVANSCSTSGSACTQNASDICCTATCYPGACCADATCKASLGASAVCSNHTCTTCDAVVGANPVYLVDPINGDDGSATGTGTSSGGTPTISCSFATITRALQAIGPNPAAGTTIKIIGASTVPYVANAKAIKEVFPIVVPSNVIITAKTGLVTIVPPANSGAFSFIGAASGVDGTLGGGSMLLEGKTHNAFIGVHAGTGTTDGTILRNVTIQNFQQEGVLVSNAGVLSIGQGVNVLSNGVGSPNLPGLHLTGSAHVTINVPDGQATTSFNKNGQHGILVAGTASVNIQGAQTAGTGTIECRQNSVAGLAISQTPGASLPLNTVNGLVVVGTTNGNGIRIEGGSNVKVSSSWSLGNAGSGVLVATSLVGVTRNNST
ncbi:MAG TPA: hypothetical protein VHW01_23920, partial [Polyangiaceae bacterium]|nr:hypothetical protein [Polyangiaceae bacterium]